MARGKAWTFNEDRTIKDLVEKGFGSNHIGEVIGRSRDGVRKRIKQLGLKDGENQEIKATEEQPQEIIKPVVDDNPDNPGRYKIRYLIDGVQEKTIWVAALSEQRAIRGLIRKLNEWDAYGTYDIIKVEDFEPSANTTHVVQTPVPEMIVPVKKFDEIIESVNDGAKKKNDEELVKEIQQSIEERFEKKEEDETVKRDRAGEFKEVLEERSVKPVEYVTKELIKEELPLAYYDCERCLTVKGITLSPEETLKVVDFAVQVWKTL